MERKRFQDKPDIITFSNKIKQLYTISEFSFVRRAFQSVVFDKLFLDGYIQGSTIQKDGATSVCQRTPVFVRRKLGFFDRLKSPENQWFSGLFSFCDDPKPRNNGIAYFSIRPYQIEGGLNYITKRTDSPKLR